jgi:hypothetical protein
MKRKRVRKFNVEMPGSFGRKQALRLADQGIYRNPGSAERYGIRTSQREKRAFPLLDLRRRDRSQLYRMDLFQPFLASALPVIELRRAFINSADIRNNLTETFTVALKRLRVAVSFPLQLVNELAYGTILFDLRRRFNRLGLESL